MSKVYFRNVFVGCFLTAQVPSVIKEDIAERHSATQCDYQVVEVAKKKTRAEQTARNAFAQLFAN